MAHKQQKITTKKCPSEYSEIDNTTHVITIPSIHALINKHILLNYWLLTFHHTPVY